MNFLLFEGPFFGGNKTRTKTSAPFCTQHITSDVSPRDTSREGKVEPTTYGHKLFVV